MDWHEITQFLGNHAMAAGVGIGTTLGLGGGAGIIAFLHHMPPPYEEQVWIGAVYDTLQDRIKNMERIGKRRTRPIKETSV